MVTAVFPPFTESPWGPVTCFQVVGIAFLWAKFGGILLKGACSELGPNPAPWRSVAAIYFTDHKDLTFLSHAGYSSTPYAL